MKLSRSLLLLLSTGLVLPLTSCEKVKELAGTAKGWVSGDSDSNGKNLVVSVNEKEGKEIIAEETRLVVVEFYSDG